MAWNDQRDPKHSHKTINQSEERSHERGKCNAGYCFATGAAATAAGQVHSQNDNRNIGKVRGRKGGEGGGGMHSTAPKHVNTQW